MFTEHECEACSDGCLPIGDGIHGRTDYGVIENEQCKCPAYMQFEYKGSRFWLCFKHYEYWTRG